VVVRGRRKYRDPLVARLGPGGGTAVSAVGMLSWWELEGLGYVERRNDSSDRRAKWIHLTRKGKRCNEIEWKVVRDVDSSLESLLGTKLLHDLRRALTKITGASDRI
jgi:hypothetical protein